MNPKQGDIFLVPIPFSDLRASKRRPVLVVSRDDYNESNEDCLVMAITSQINARKEYAVVFDNQDLAEGLLPKISQIRADKVYSVHQKILVRRFGHLSSAKHQAALELLKKLTALKTTPSHPLLAYEYVAP